MNEFYAAAISHGLDPGPSQEAIHDLTRALDDKKCKERKARQQFNAFVLRHRHT